jgi:hypothetical protein
VQKALTRSSVSCTIGAVEDVVQLTHKAIKTLQQRGELVSTRRIAAEVGVSVTALRTYLAVHSLLWDIYRYRHRINAHRRDTPSQDKCDALLSQAQQVIAQLHEEGTPVTLLEVPKRLQLSRYVLQQYAAPWQYVQDQLHLDMQWRNEQSGSQRILPNGNPWLELMRSTGKP